MDPLILWMRKRKGITISASAVYFASVVLLHEEVSKVSVWLQKSLTLNLYNRLITVFSISLVGFMSLYALLKLRVAENRGLRVAYLSVAFFSAAASYNTLIVSNVEAIHFPQYAFLVLPLLALTGSYSEALLSVSLLGAFDEAYQYFIFKNWTYFDFNDILLNVIGGCIGAAFLYTVLGKGFGSREKPRSLMKSCTPVGCSSFTRLTMVLRPSSC
jgi:glycopeptide antibiotics resistance protein